MPGGTRLIWAETMIQSRLLRCIDVCLSFVMFIVTLPVMAVVLIYVYAVSQGPLLIEQVRVGRDGVPFKLIKIRTMHPEAETDHQPVLAALDDHRIIRGGRTLRALHVDELPQLLNVMRGDMSMVGPRPERPEFVEQLSRNLDGYDRRHDVRPGITGRAQVVGGYYMDPRDKLDHDLSYLEQQNLWRYVSVLCMTPVGILRDLRFTHVAQAHERSESEVAHLPLPRANAPVEHERSA